MAIRVEQETSVVIDTDQWSSGSLCAQQQGTFTHTCTLHGDAYGGVLFHYSNKEDETGDDDICTKL